MVVCCLSHLEILKNVNISGTVLLHQVVSILLKFLENIVEQNKTQNTGTNVNNVYGVAAPIIINVPDS